MLEPHESIAPGAHQIQLLERRAKRGGISATVASSSLKNAKSCCGSKRGCTKQRCAC